ncbi:uncharacterized protein LOC115928463 [Strongylocentrotus purpuratus]|uniref:Uncharacterized protein n=1 Tax=Strongylocentrotus purpuratus TaxID=7668 RepID=A0A7M7PIB5_STRPU|nr:uncharacterized protein LOC115928463 [Strongylocentrotus purpuratus]
MLPGPGIPDPLQNVLQLTDQDIADRLDASHPLTAFALLKIWKEKPRPSVFNYRAALAYELRRTQMPGLADEVAAGKYMEEGTSLAFIEDMVRGLHQDQLECLGNILKLSGTDRWSTITPSDAISKKIFDWVAKWTNEMETCRKSRARQPVKTDMTKVPGGSVLRDVTATKMLLDHRDLNDLLVQHGFLDFAREIMIIEQRSVAGLLA